MACGGLGVDDTGGSGRVPAVCNAGASRTGRPLPVSGHHYPEVPRDRGPADRLVGQVELGFDIGRELSDRVMVNRTDVEREQRPRVATDGNAMIPSGPARLARPASTTLACLDGWVTPATGRGPG